MKGSTAGSNQKAPAGEQMRSCLSEKVNVSAQTVHTWSHPLRFAGEKLATLGAKRQCLLQQNGIHLFAYMLMQLLHLKQISSRFLDLGSDRIKAPVFTPCFSGFGTPQRKRRGRSMTAMEKEQRRHLLMIHRTGPHGGEKVRMSHFPLSVYHFITRTLWRWEPADALSFSCPPLAPRPPCTKRAQRAIWLWVMEGGLNSPSEILEPVGKPQLFKCRKSWFYKMLTWSAQGTGEQNGSAKEAPSIDPHRHLSGEGEQREREVRALTKEGEIKADNYNEKMERVWKQSPFILVKSCDHSAPAAGDLICKNKQVQRKVKRDDKTTQYGPQFLYTASQYFWGGEPLAARPLKAQWLWGKWNFPFL